MRALAGRTLAGFASWAVGRLQNGSSCRLSREELRFMQISFGQFGEDLAVVRRIADAAPASRIYVDAGCFHPIHFSNTLLLHKAGWRGINVDLSSSRIAEFDELRPGDHNVCATLSSAACEMAILEYGSGATDRVAAQDSIEQQSLIGERPVGTRLARTTTLNDILRSCPWPVTSIGYLNVDCEGHDLDVLQGLDLEFYVPAVITIEAFADSRAATIDYLGAHGYEHVETMHHTLLFV